MEFSELVATRKMTREFSDVQVEASLISELLEVVRYSPSAGFTQGFRFLVLTDSDVRKSFFKTTSDKNWLDNPDSSKITTAPVIVIPFSLPETYIERYNQPDKLKAHRNANFIEANETPFWLTDMAFATMLLLLRAEDLGLGALFFAIHGGIDNLKESLNIPESASLIGAVAVGYKSETGQRHLRKRLSADQLVKYNSWH